MDDYAVFHRESNNFSDILTDPVIKKSIRMQMSFKDHLILTLKDDKDFSYLILKFGDDITNMSSIIPDRSPIAGKDYTPKRQR